MNQSRSCVQNELVGESGGGEDDNGTATAALAESVTTHTTPPSTAALKHSVGSLVGGRDRGSPAAAEAECGDTG